MVWAVAVAGVTDMGTKFLFEVDNTKGCSQVCSILAAALSLVPIAHADTAPERGVISLKAMDYHDSQPGQDRIGIDAKSLRIMTPIAGEWSVEAGLTSDTVSGASPYYHTQALTPMHDKRTGRNIQLTRYFSRGQLSVGHSYSSESDYFSQGYSVQGSVSTEDKNSTLNFGLGSSNDVVNALNAPVPVLDQPKKTLEVMLGITQILTMYDIAQLNLSYSSGRGDFSDPYKVMDHRPDHKRQTTLVTRWNHHFAQTEGTGQFSYRYYTDSFGIHAHTLDNEYVQPLAHDWTLTPGIRLYTQNAASFYLDPDPANPTLPTTPPGYDLFSFAPPTMLTSQDQRLAAFGAITYGFKLANQLTPDWTVDLKFQHYEQQSKWCLSGKGSPGLAPLSAKIIQVGVARYF